MEEIKTAIKNLQQAIEKERECSAAEVTVTRAERKDEETQTFDLDRRASGVSEKKIVDGIDAISGAISAAEEVARKVIAEEMSRAHDLPGIPAKGIDSVKSRLEECSDEIGVVERMSIEVSEVAQRAIAAASEQESRSVYLFEKLKEFEGLLTEAEKNLEERAGMESTWKKRIRDLESRVEAEADARSRVQATLEAESKKASDLQRQLADSMKEIDRLGAALKSANSDLVETSKLCERLALIEKRKEK